MSKEEARLAYEARCRRHLQQQQSHRDRPQPTNISLSAGATEFIPTTAAAADSGAAGVTGVADAAGRHR